MVFGVWCLVFAAVVGAKWEGSIPQAPRRDTALGPPGGEIRGSQPCRLDWLVSHDLHRAPSRLSLLLNAILALG